MNINKSTKKENLPIQTTKNELTNFDDKSKTQQLKEVLEIVEKYVSQKNGVRYNTQMKQKQVYGTTRVLQVFKNTRNRLLRPNFRAFPNFQRRG